MVGEVEKLIVKNCFAYVSANNYLLHVIVEYLYRDTLQIMESMDVAVQKAFQAALFNKFDIHSSAEPQDHQEHIFC